MNCILERDLKLSLKVIKVELTVCTLQRVCRECTRTMFFTQLNLLGPLHWKLLSTSLDKILDRKLYELC